MNTIRFWGSSSPFPLISAVLILWPSVSFAGAVIDQQACKRLLERAHGQRIGRNLTALTQAVKSNDHIDTALMNSDLGRTISRQIQGHLSQPDSWSEAALNDQQTLAIAYRGLNKGTAIVLQDRSHNQTTLLTSDELDSEANVAIWNFYLSPDKRRMAVSYTRDGSIDDFYFLVFDLESRKILIKDIQSPHNEVVWLSDSRFLFGRQTAKSIRGLQQFDLQTKQTTVVARIGDIESINDQTALVEKGDQSFIIINGNEYELPKLIRGKVLGTTEQDVYILSESGTWGQGVVYAVNRKSFSSSNVSIRTVIPENSHRLVAGKLLNGFLIIKRIYGTKSDTLIYTEAGNLAAVIPTPEGCDLLANWKWIAAGEKIVMEFSNPIWRSKKFTFDLILKKFDRDVTNEMLTGPRGDRFEQSIMSAVSEDGIEVPVRLFHKKDLLDERNGLHPIVLAVYGGFNKTDNLQINFDAMNEEFLVRGGILGAASLRGDGDLGKGWHLGGNLKSKHHTFNDLAAVGKKLIQDKISQPRFIISTGTSNGGFTVAATALLHPDIFGLAIPVNGTLDSEHRDELDARFGGWNSELGNVRDAEIGRQVCAYSPVQLAKNASSANILVITGMNDSRVHPLHSYRFVRELLQNPNRNGECYWLTLDKAGHWAGSKVYTYSIANWRFQAVKWTAIFKQAGF